MSFGIVITPPAPLTYKETSRESSEHGSGSNASTGEAVVEVAEVVLEVCC